MNYSLIGALALCVANVHGPATEAAKPEPMHVDMQYYKLPNGLKVVLARDTSTPMATVSVYYGIGFRTEPRELTGFAHLFEHLMFQGSENAPKGTLTDTINYSGGSLNGSTRFDFTSYYEVVPSNAVARMLWLDADRMARPVINDEVLRNQQGVVGNEVKGNVLNRPYGSWPWIDMPMLANSNWSNSHNFYGDLHAIEAATVQDAEIFRKKYYQPGNAVLVVAGDIDYAATRAMIARYFGPIPKSQPAPQPDIDEPRQTQERFGSRVDPLAPQPGFAVGYHVPPRGTPEWYAMGLIDQMLISGRASRLYRKLVLESGIASQFDGGINYQLGSMFDYRGPMLWTFSFTHDPSVSRDTITKAIDAVIDDVRTRPVSAEELAQARTRLRRSLYDTIDTQGHLGLVDLLASYALFDDDPEKVNHMEEGFDKVTPELILKTAQDYLRPTNRTISIIEAGAKGGTQ